MNKAEQRALFKIGFKASVDRVDPCRLVSTRSDSWPMVRRGYNAAQEYKAMRYPTMTREQLLERMDYELSRIV